MLLMPVTSGGSRVQPKSTAAPPERAAAGGFYIFYGGNCKLMVLAVKVEI